MAEIGGEEACAALERKLFVDAESAKYSHVSGYTLEAVVSGIERARCRTAEEVDELLWRFGRDMWPDKWVHEVSLEILADEGDKKAAAILDRYRTTLEAYRQGGYESYSLSEFRGSLLDGSLPWYLKAHIANGLRYKDASSKEAILDLYLRAMSAWYAVDASVRFTSRNQWFIELGRGIVRSRRSAWQGWPEDFFDGNVDRFDGSPTSFNRDRMVELIEYLRDTEQE
ncbi:MAG: hypothetical protein RRA32_10880 [bacterium]|nr:hypothetical protein [bacterium]